MEALFFTATLTISAIVAGALAHHNISIKSLFFNRLYLGVFLSGISLVSILSIIGVFSNLSSGVKYYDRALIISTVVRCSDKDNKNQLTSLTPRIDIAVSNDRSVTVKVNLIDDISLSKVRKKRELLMKCEPRVIFNRSAFAAHWGGPGHSIKLGEPKKRTAREFTKYYYDLIKPPDIKRTGRAIFKFSDVVQKASYADRLLELLVTARNPENELITVVSLPHNAIPKSTIPDPDGMSSGSSSSLYYEGIGELGYRVQRKNRSTEQMAANIIFNEPVAEKIETSLMVLLSALMGLGFALSIEALMGKHSV